MGVLSMEMEPLKNVTHLFPVGSKFDTKKKLTLSMETDFVVRLFENDVPMNDWMVKGVDDLITGKWKEKNLTSMPKISLSIHLDHSGIPVLKDPKINVEEAYWVNVTIERNKTNATNTTGANST